MVNITVQSRVHQERKCTDLRMFGESLKPPPFMGFLENWASLADANGLENRTT